MLLYLFKHASRTSQTLAKPSDPVETSLYGVKVDQETILAPPLCPLSIAIGQPVFNPQTRTSPSSDAVAKKQLSHETSISLITPACPRKVQTKTAPRKFAP